MVVQHFKFFLNFLNGRHILFNYTYLSSVVFSYIRYPWFNLVNYTFTFFKKEVENPVWILLPLYLNNLGVITTLELGVKFKLLFYRMFHITTNLLMKKLIWHSQLTIALKINSKKKICFQPFQSKKKEMNQERKHIL